jgi:hypothetical protein
MMHNPLDTARPGRYQGQEVGPFSNRLAILPLPGAWSLEPGAWSLVNPSHCRLVGAESRAKFTPRGAECGAFAD